LQAFVDFEILVGEGVYSARDYPHLVFVESQVLDAVGIAYEGICAIDELWERECFVGSEVETELFKLLE
jgi:hypothetical protein